MQAATRRSPKPATTPPPHRPLDDLLAGLVSAHERLAEASSAQREAIRRADARALAAARARMSDACATLASLEEERRLTVAALAPGSPQSRLSTLADELPEPQRSRAIDLASRLRTLAEHSRSEQRRLHEATGSMLRHVRGLVQHMQRSLNHAGVYGRAGRVEPGASVISGIDLTR